MDTRDSPGGSSLTYSRLWRLGAACVLLLTLSGCGGGVVASTRTGSGGSTSAVTTEAPTATDTVQLDAAFASYERIVTSCAVEPQAGSVKIGVVNATGVSWAIAKFQPASTCVINSAAPIVGSDRTTTQINPDRLRVFADPPVGVFERSARGGWQMNQEGGIPFPCPAPSGIAPGLGNGAIPAEVLSSWGLPYAANCSTVRYPPVPR